MFRWQTSGLILAPTLLIALLLGLPVWLATVIANLLGGALYWYFDNWLLNKSKKVQ